MTTFCMRTVPVLATTDQVEWIGSSATCPSFFDSDLTPVYQESRAQTSYRPLSLKLIAFSTSADPGGRHQPIAGLASSEL